MSGAKLSALRFKGDKARKRKRPRSDDAVDEASSRAIAKMAAADAGDDNSDGQAWTDSEVIEDFKGPVLIAFAATVPVCLACDALGTVFASQLETVSDEDLSTAEPTAVAQVWMAAKIYGTEKYSFKSSSGKYLSCDKHGLLSATREAISPEEEFLPVRSELGGPRWALQTCRDSFLSVDEIAAGGKIAICGDAETVGFKETWTIRLQERNKSRAQGGSSGREGKIRDRVTRKELEEAAGISLDEEQLKVLKRARKKGNYNEALLDLRVKYGKHDKYTY